MSGLSVNLANVESDAQAFPSGVYPARILDAVLDVSKSSGNPMITMKLEIYHPQLGTAVIRDWLVPSFASKIKTFYQAVNNWSAQDLADSLARNSDIELDPDEMKGAELLVQVGESEPNDSGRVFKNVVPPFFYPYNRVDLIAWQEEDLPF